MQTPLQVARAIITDPSGSLLIGRRAYSDPLGGAWELFGGKIDEGENPQDALIREIFEETGITLDSSAIEALILHKAFLPNQRILETNFFHISLPERPDSIKLRSDEHSTSMWLCERRDIPLKITQSSRWMIETWFDHAKTLEKVA